jgi:hypothetical protein
LQREGLPVVPGGCAGVPAVLVGRAEIADGGRLAVQPGRLLG